MLLLAGPAWARAQDDDLGFGASSEDATGEDATSEDDDDGFGARAAVPGEPEVEEDAWGRSSVTRAHMDERQPRAAPDALRWEPGIAIQLTSHAQASPYVRGMTGQQVVHLFDGIRLNNGIYRQGPNQYFFTVDQRSVQQLDVLRGSSSVRFGSDALGGAILALPRSPVLDLGHQGLSARPNLSLRYGSADRELGGRAELELRMGPDTALLIGGGYRDVSLLTSGGVVRHRDRTPDPTTRGDLAPWVPRFEEESSNPGQLNRWRTQLGTGFREATFDARLVHRLRPKLRAIAAVYGYRQLDAPRTDQCPAPEAPLDECLFIDRQFRTLSYLALRGDAGPMRDVDLIVSHQRHEEARRRDRPRSNIEHRWKDVVDTFGVTFRAATPRHRVLAMRLRYGFEMFRDQVSTSNAFRTFTDTLDTRELSRGQYLDGSHFLQLGVWSEASIEPLPWLALHGGGRVAVVDAGAPPDPESGTRSVVRTFHAVLARGGVTLRPHDAVRVHANVDQGFRAPNLDDLTSRQQVGPGFQFENADLTPERTITTELGIGVRHSIVRFDAWGYATLLDDAIQRVVREIADCPPSTPDCAGSRDPFQLVNAERRSRIFGTEGGLTLFLPRDVTLRSTFSYAWGEGPPLGDRDGAEDDLPLSRIPPPQGTFEGRYRHRGTGIWGGVGLRWAAKQDRLAISDQSDPRIPDGGTPGYATLDLRLGFRFRNNLAMSVVMENVTDTAYRVHGSSVNGPGRGVLVWIRGGL